MKRSRLLSSIKKIVILCSTAIGLITLTAKAQVKKVTLAIDFSRTYQTIENFGASDAWSGQFVGNWPEVKKNEIADLLFSNGVKKDGSPKGIGLSLWRFNIGAGSTGQGTVSGIKDEWKRTESFLNIDGTYNLQNQKGQIWFLKAAKQRGVKQFLGFSNSPSINYTINGKAYSSDGNVNIAKAQYDNFANYLSNVVKGVRKITNIDLNYISPVNEPQWDWKDGNQEGCPYTNEEISGLVKAIDRSFTDNKIQSKIIIGEAGKINYLYSKADKINKANQAAAFFRPGSLNYIGDLSRVARTITAHSYFTTSPMSAAIKARKALADTISQFQNLNFWQSEYCILGDNEGEIKGNGRDLGIDAALYVASVIHHDLTIANATAWQWWLAISPYNYKDGLIYIDKNEKDGNYYISKMLWALGNYSRFIKPGAIRVAIKPALSALPDGLMVSAYKNKKQLTMVIINAGKEDYEIDAGGISINATYETSAESELKLAKPKKSPILVKARSILTVTGNSK
jgi:O-glycosyl hydrolase